MEQLFATERLVARRLVAADAPAMAAVYGDVDAMRFVGDGRPLNEEMCLHWVDVTNGNFARRGYGMVAFEDKATGEAIAFAGIVHPGQQPEAELKYALRRDVWGRGLATEIAQGLVAFARSAWGVGTIQATVAPGNLPSQRVVTKAGFRHASDRDNEDGSITQVWLSEL